MFFLYDTLYPSHIQAGISTSSSSPWVVVGGGGVLLVHLLKCQVQ